MINFVQKIKDYSKVHKIMTSMIVVSGVISLLLFILCLCSVLTWLTALASLLVFVPPLLIILVAFLVNKIKNHPVWRCIITILLTSFLILFQLIYSIIFILVYSELTKDIPYNNPRNYQSIIKKWSKQDNRIYKIFPNKVPKGAKNVVMKGGSGPFYAVFGYNEIAIGFNTTDEYITELKNKCKSITPIKNAETYPNTYNHSIPLSLIDTGSDLYTIVSENEYPDENHENTYFGGVVINEKTNKVVYFYQAFYGDYCGGCYDTKVK